MKRHHDHLKLMALGLAVIILVGLALGVRDVNRSNAATRDLVDETGVQLAEVQAFLIASRESRLAFQARETFLLCSREPTQVMPGRRAEVAEACEGYETLDAAITTERVRQAAGSG